MVAVLCREQLAIIVREALVQNLILFNTTQNVVFFISSANDFRNLNRQNLFKFLNSANKELTSV